MTVVTPPPAPTAQDPFARFWSVTAAIGVAVVIFLFVFGACNPIRDTQAQVAGIAATVTALPSNAAAPLPTPTAVDLAPYAKVADVQTALNSFATDQELADALAALPTPAPANVVITGTGALTDVVALQTVVVAQAQQLEEQGDDIAALSTAVTVLQNATPVPGGAAAINCAQVLACVNPTTTPRPVGIPTVVVVPPTVAPPPAVPPTTTPRPNNPPSTPVPPANTPVPPSTCTPIWGDEDDFGPLQSGDTPVGDATAWTVVQVWDGLDVSTTVHMAIAPNVVVRIPAHWQASKWHVWIPCPQAEQDLIRRVNQMAEEAVARDDIPFPRVFIIRAPGDPVPNSWVVQYFN